LDLDSTPSPHPLLAFIASLRVYLLHRREERLRDRKGHAVFLLFIVAWFRRRRRSSWHSRITNHSGASGSRASSIASRLEMTTAALTHSCIVKIQILIA
jgi:hypothetical protein